MRGDRPLNRLVNRQVLQFTPHARGSTLLHFLYRLVSGVYPACAGIDPCHQQNHWPNGCLPRMRGDRPLTRSITTLSGQFTPHARGSTLNGCGILTVLIVYPACAGIDLPNWDKAGWSGSLPRMRGDRPKAVASAVQEHGFTPHARGSTLKTVHNVVKVLVYPACAGIDRPVTLRLVVKGRLPRMRGDRPKSGLG